MIMFLEFKIHRLKSRHDKDTSLVLCSELENVCVCVTVYVCHCVCVYVCVSICVYVCIAVRVG